MQIDIDWPVVSAAVFAGGVECNPPGMGRGGSENAAALSISLEVQGLGKEWGPEWTPGPLCCNLALLPSLPLTPRGRGQGTPRPDALKLGGGEARLAG